MINSNNRFYFVFVLFLLFINCQGQSIFTDHDIDREIICDTIFDSTIRSKFLITSLFEKASSQQKEIKSTIYSAYSLSLFEKTSENLVRFDQGKLYFYPNFLDSKSKYKKDQLFIDFEALVGSSWKINYGGVFSNSILRLDSIDKEHGLHYVSSKAMYDISDRTRVRNFSISKTQGFQHITLEHSSGAVINCDCLKD